MQAGRLITLWYRSVLRNGTPHVTARKGRVAKDKPPCKTCRMEWKKCRRKLFTCCWNCIH